MTQVVDAAYSDPEWQRIANRSPMQTQRLRTFMDPRQARLLLDSYVAKIGGLPAVAVKRLDLAKLPLAFQERAEEAESQGLVYSAWTHGSNAWLFIGQLNLNRARERGQPVLEVDAFDYERRIKTRTIALRSPSGNWQVLKD